MTDKTRTYKDQSISKEEILKRGWCLWDLEGGSFAHIVRGQYYWFGPCERLRSTNEGAIYCNFHENEFKKQEQI